MDVVEPMEDLSAAEKAVVKAVADALLQREIAMDLGDDPAKTYLEKDLRYFREQFPKAFRLGELRALELIGYYKEF